MRIVGGRLRGRRLATPSGGATRPTTDRTREALFNILEHRFAGCLESARILDLFAGTGALGLEALSRGAAYAHFVETDAAARGLIRTNLEALELNGRAKIYRRDATKLGSIGTLQPFDLVFLDPPYCKSLGEKALAAAVEGGWLADEPLIVWEEATEADIALPTDFGVDSQRIFGDTAIRFLKRQDKAEDG